MAARRFRIVSCQMLLGAAVALVGAGHAAAQLVPGTGVKVKNVGDDLEDPNWSFQPNGPKSSYDLDKNMRAPLGVSANRRWFEGPKRGYPDIVKRVPTPPGGIPGSEGALLLRTLNSGIPGRFSYQTQQDDFIVDVTDPLGGQVPVRLGPSCVVRVFLPRSTEWEPRTGVHFALRAGLKAPAPPQRSRSRNAEPDDGTYWPGIFIHFDHQTRACKFIIRANEQGVDYESKPIPMTGWWTLGISVTPDGQVHYYARQGVEDLREEDRLASHFPYGRRCQTFGNFFFNVWNHEDGQTWSTPWIIDDPTLYVTRGSEQ